MEETTEIIPQEAPATEEVTSEEITSEVISNENQTTYSLEETYDETPSASESVTVVEYDFQAVADQITVTNNLLSLVLALGIFQFTFLIFLFFYLVVRNNITNHF